MVDVSYLWQVTANTSITPNLQWIGDPANNPKESSIWVAGIRLRIAL